MGLIGLNFFDDSLQNYDNPVSVADLADLPSDFDFANLGPEIAAIEGEIDEDSNPIIRDMKAQCSRDQLDYCVGESWKSKDHTMCKFCVSMSMSTKIKVPNRESKSLKQQHSNLA